LLTLFPKQSNHSFTVSDFKFVQIVRPTTDASTLQIVEVVLNSVPFQLTPLTKNSGSSFANIYQGYTFPRVLPVASTLHNEMRHPTYVVCVSAANGSFCTSLCLFMPLFVTHPPCASIAVSFFSRVNFSPNDLFSVRFHFSLYTHVVLIIYSDCNTYYALLFQIFIP
jgi:hypothetical protein